MAEKYSQPVSLATSSTAKTRSIHSHDEDRGEKNDESLTYAHGDNQSQPREIPSDSSSVAMEQGMVDKDLEKQMGSENDPEDGTPFRDPNLIEW